MTAHDHPAMPEPPTTPWLPDDLPIAAAEAAAWTYVVLEEIIDGVALLRRWPWPVVDQIGRLRWLHGTAYDTDSRTINIGLLRDQLYTAANHIDRAPRCGDTFAVRHTDTARWRGTRTHDLRDLFGTSDVYDISADARETVKIAYQSSLAAVGRVRADDPDLAEHFATLKARSKHPLQPLTVAPPPASAVRPRSPA